MAASASVAKPIFMNPARGNGEATGYHMRHDQSALPGCGARREPEAPISVRAGTRRLGEEQSGQAQLRHRRRRDAAAPDLRAVQDGSRDPGAQRPLCGRSAGAHRSDRGTGRRPFRPGAHASEERRSARPRHHRRDPRRGSARYSDARRERLSRRDIDLGHGNSRSRGNTQGNRRAAQFEAERADRARGDSRQDEGLRSRAPERPAGGVRRVGGPGTAAMDARREAVRRQGRLKMARVAAAFGSSHSVMLAAELQDWLRGFRQSDLRMKYYDREGRPRSYADVLAGAPSHIAQLITDEAITGRFNEVQDAMERLKSA